VTAERQQQSPSPPFEVIEPYERMIEQRERDPRAYRMQHSAAERNAVEYYLIAKRKAESDSTRGKVLKL
jgi:hypothetical protein